MEKVEILREDCLHRLEESIEAIETAGGKTVGLTGLKDGQWAQGIVVSDTRLSTPAPHE